MTVKFTNNASTTIGTGINASATSLTVASASSFPSLSGADDYCYLTLQGATNTTREVVKATALSGNTFTIVRAQDNTSAASWLAGDIVELRMTAALLTDVIDAATVEGVKTNYQYTPTAGQTVFSGADNASATMIINQAALVSVYMNGVRLVQGTDYSVSSANNTVTLGIGATTADIIDIEVYGNFVGQSGAAVGITGGSITGTAITATSLGATGTATLNTLVSNNATISGGSLDGVTIGGTTRGAISGNAISGTSFASTGNMTFGDNNKAIFGAGSDLQIYHDGSNSYIDDAATGHLFIRSNGDGIYLRSNTNEEIAHFNVNGSVKAYYDNSLKLATTATGIDVTGTVTADGLTVDGLAAISSTTPELRMFETDTTDLNTQLRSGVGKFEIKTLNDAVTLATKRFELDHATGDISFYNDAAAQGLFWDSSASRLGLGTTLPAQKLDVRSASSGVVARISGPNAYNAESGLEFSIGRAKISGVLNSGGGTPGTSLRFHTMPDDGSITEAMRIDASGDLNLVNTGLASLNFTTDGSSDYARITGGKSGSGVGELQFWTYSSGISRAATIDASGRLLINKTNNDGSLNLQVKAPTGFSVGSGFYSGGAQSTIEFQDANTTANYKVRIGSETDDLLMFAGGTERMRIAADGSISTPTAGTSNVRLGVNAGNSIASGGNYNTVVGDEAGTALSTGDYNTALGFDAGKAVDTGFQNTLIGGLAGSAMDTGNLNTAVGIAALTADTKGQNSTAIGRRALATQNFTSATDSYNTAVGALAGEKVTTGIQNTLIGGLAGDALQTGYHNVALGYAALTSDTNGSSSVAIGNEALSTQNLTIADDSYNVAVGDQTGKRLTYGTFNTLLGALAGGQITTGQDNIIIGFAAGAHTTNLQTGSRNVLLGAYIDTTTTGATDAIGLGYNVSAAGGYTTLGVNTSDIRAQHGVATWATVSDQRYKKDIVDSTTGLSFINALRPRTFKYKTLGELPETFNAYEEGSTEVFKNSDTNHGFIAQEIKAAIDADSSIADGFKLWDDREDGSQEVAEAALIPVLVKAIQELSAQNAALTARIAALEE